MHMYLHYIYMCINVSTYINMSIYSYMYVVIFTHSFIYICTYQIFIRVAVGWYRVATGASLCVLHTPTKDLKSTK
jgi:hypothetical protein